jgi:hypothetical protein
MLLLSELLFERDDLLPSLLACFTLEDAKHYLSVVCRPLNQAIKEAARKPDKAKPFKPYMSLDAALERLGRRYTPGPCAAVAAVASTLYAQCAAGILLFWEHTSKSEGRTILGFQGFYVLDHTTWRDQMLHLASTHPAFKRPDAGRYAYHSDRPVWCVYDVLRDIGLRCVTGSARMWAGTDLSKPKDPGPLCPLRYTEYLFRNDVTYTQILRELGLHLRLQRAACWPWHRERETRDV